MGIISVHSIFLIGLVFFQLAFVQSVRAAKEESCPDVMRFSLRPLGGGEPINICKKYLGKVVMIVNTASKCGFTPQYEGLEKLYRHYREKGLVILGFPSNDFGGQEPGSEKEIAEFCRLTYGVEFPMFQKTHASESKADPIYKTLAKVSGEYPAWNFHKYIIDRKGNLVASYNSKVLPQSKRLVDTIEQLL